LGEVQKANQIIRSLLSTVEEERVSAARHILHLQALRKYQLDNNKDVLTLADIEKLYEEDVILENPDVDMDDDNPAITGPSTNRSLTAQSLSNNGFTDSDSDYVP
jgi:hypothetical protein